MAAWFRRPTINARPDVLVRNRVTERATSRRAGQRFGTDPLPLHIWIALIGISVTIFWVSVPTLVGFYQLSLGLAFVLASAQCASIPLVGRWPRSALTAHLLALASVGWSTRLVEGELWPLSVPALFGLTVMLAVIGVRERWTTSIAAWWTSFLVLVVVVVTGLQPGRSTPEWGFNVLVCVTVTLAAVGGSMALGQRKHVRRLLAEARRDVELEHARRESAEDRARIARELHDVVAHSMSIVHIQAESAQFRLAHLDHVAANEFADIARSARTALREMRQLLGALRTEDSDHDLAPQPTIDAVPSLLDNAAKVGTEATLELDLGDDPVPQIVQLTAYRIIQEGLSNAVRHAPFAPVRVSVISDRRTLVVVVETGPSLAQHIARTPLVAGGQGHRGIRERVALLGGTVDYGAVPGGGFLVSASIPLSPSPREVSP